MEVLARTAARADEPPSLPARFQPRSATPRPTRRNLPASRIMAGMVATLLALLVLHLLVVWSFVAGIHVPGRGLFYFDNENNLPTFYSMMLMLIASVLAILIAGQAKTAGQGYSAHWSALGMILLAMACDETISIHERLIAPMREALGIPDGPGPLQFAWVLAGMVAVVGFLIAYWRFTWQLPPRTRWRFVDAAMVYVLGAIGFEMLGGPLYDDEVFAIVHEGATGGFSVLPSMLVSTLEELLEMVGLLLAIDGLLGHLRQQPGKTIIRVT